MGKSKDQNSSCGNVKLIVLIAVAILYILLGAVLVGFGIFARTYGHMYHKYLQKSHQAFPYELALILLGLSVSLTGLIGCFCSLSVKCGCTRCCTILFAVTLIGLSYAEIRTAIYIYTVGRDMSEVFPGRFNNSMHLYHTPNVTQEVDRIQEMVQCCGLESYQEWEKTKFGNVPESCCKEKTKCGSTEGNTEGNTSNYYDPGCSEKLIENFKKIKWLVTVIIVTFLFVQLLWSLLVCHHMNVVNKRSESSRAESVTGKKDVQATRTSLSTRALYTQE